MRLRNTLLLAAAFILLGAYIYFFELQKRQKAEKLLNFKEEEVEGIILNYPEEEIRLKKEVSGKWRITHPLQAPADDVAVTTVLSSLSASEVQRKVEESPSAEDLKTFGLAVPEVKVLLTLKGGAPLPAIQVGAKTPLGNSAYVKRGSQPAVLLSGGSLRSGLEKKLSDFRNKKIVEFKEQAVKRLALNGDNGDFLLSKKGEEWFIDKPESYRADQTEIKTILAVLRNLSAKEFVEDSPSNLRRYGLDKPRLQITLSMGEKEERREILFGNKREGKEESYLAVESKQTVYAVPESAYRELDKELAALRDKEVLPFARDQVAKLEIQSQKESVALVKEKEDWYAEAPKKVRAKPETVADYLSAVGLLKAKGFAKDDPKNAKKYGFVSPSLKISLEAKDGKNLGTLVVGNKIAGDYYAKREGNPTVYTIDRASYDQIKKQLTDFLP